MSNKKNFIGENRIKELIEYVRDTIISRSLGFSFEGDTLTIGNTISGNGGCIPNYDDLIAEVTGFTYTATQDCYIEVQTYSDANGYEERYTVNGVLLGKQSLDYAVSMTFTKGFFLKNGDVLSVRDTEHHSVSMKVFGLTSVSSSGASQEYSTDEQVVGKWIDGKPLYEKSFIQTTGGEQNIDLTSLNVEKGFVVKGHYKTASGEDYPENLFYAGNIYTRTFIYQNGKTLRTDIQGFSLSLAEITIQYTKTTD